jgi:phage tail tape-measure protein
MATKTPRIQVTLSQDAYRIVDRLAVVQHSNRSTIIAELVNDLSPVLAGLLETMEAAAKVREENLQGVRDASYSALERLQPLLDQAEEEMGLLDLMLKRSGDEPPTCNTGVTTEITHSKQSKSASSKKGGK